MSLLVLNGLCLFADHSVKSMDVARVGQGRKNGFNELAYLGERLESGHRTQLIFLMFELQYELNIGVALGLKALVR